MDGGAIAAGIPFFGTLDWDFIAENTPVFIEAAGVTLNISFWGIVFSLLLGLVCAMILELRIPVARQITLAYIEISRGTPLLIQLFLIFFGLPKLGIRWSPELSAIIGLTFLGGSYMCEAIRAGLESVGSIQYESAQVLGMGRLQTMRFIVIPQAISTSLPGIVANVIFLIKESSVVSGIALADLMYQAKDLIGMTYDTAETLLLLVITYAVILLPISIIGTILERRFDYARR
ncbi:MAG: amino acid ABC transporter permease [Coriobacteriales bacterium]|nr:amino acid ABC transporter permease [Coriobacteriales bacterium]